MQLGEMQHFNNTPLGEMQLSRFYYIYYVHGDKVLIYFSLNIHKKSLKISSFPISHISDFYIMINLYIIEPIIIKNVDFETKEKFQHIFE
ncbi:hypothetical protein H8356DRAFT_1328253 [Neocallimastix lanati (nom. inval.)]|nr:hypothetical protein H8356DRAFT_1328253 [Neocallimastix sp. JGI-2020a]